MDASTQTIVINAHLFHCLDVGSVAMVATALEKGADVNAMDTTGIAPLHIAIQNENEEMVELLLANGANPNMPTGKDNLFGQRPISQAITTNNPAIIEKLLNAGAKTGAQGDENSAMIIAATLGHPEALSALIAFGVPVNELDSKGLTPAHRASTSGSMESIEVLWRAGADFEAHNLEGLTPLEFAACGGHIGAVRKLIELGADTNKPDRDSPSPNPLYSEQKVIDCYRLMRAHRMATQISDAMKNGPQDEAGDPNESNGDQETL
jgi:cytohesin